MGVVAGSVVLGAVVVQSVAAGIIVVDCVVLGEDFVVGSFEVSVVLVCSVLVDMGMVVVSFVNVCAVVVASFEMLINVSEALGLAVVVFVIVALVVISSVLMSVCSAVLGSLVISVVIGEVVVGSFVIGEVVVGSVVSTVLVVISVAVNEGLVGLVVVGVVVVDSVLVSVSVIASVDLSATTVVSSVLDDDDVDVNPVVVVLGIEADVIMSSGVVDMGASWFDVVLGVVTIISVGLRIVTVVFSLKVVVWLELIDVTSA